MLSWGDTYPSGYGFAERTKPTWDRGPFLTSIHSGDHVSRCGDGHGVRIKSSPDVTCGSINYEHRGACNTITRAAIRLPRGVLAP